MTLAEDNGPERGGDDLLAAEYVLGVLPADERQIASRRIDTETAFARLVDAWEVHFAPMAAAYAAVEPPASVKVAIDRSLFASSASTSAAPSTSLWSSLAFWRGLAAAAIAALAVYVALPFVNPPVTQPQTRLVASLAADNSPVKYLAVYDAARHEVGLSLVSGERSAGKDFELWMIEGKNAPVSMGVIPAGQTARMAVTPAVQQKLAQGAVLAVSLEPAGGSPTGQPTGPVVAAGDLKGI
ncbi:anti-sigma factor [Mesorhizobium sp. M2D.F.Ca.ET.185.01.1.1]|uniref:anti-sigma factor n=1 Tax=unclassified Mesorhizobium TaxID=325217 RepID=UPI000FCB9A57|nr:MULTISPECIES: anti-sigma factor [unclassified Mesorhizobium]TGP81934.1 anti-sigma factor [bacterium M00.F.Ca.ET.227.01.1.1]TGP86099.1 anti-sigma factor [bacterium M00.F.Ca.ET.222.01.1.1]TGP92174.1 anti-sigma factor [bacterium M00.F.Ca.ET.221.01.1.1]TGU09852.1 anti-sigma factor [bacterium M00.F.Ca.ET.163.01.1.1]TGU39037.1 anti-sigma factor [bacterium M00.F.Ca.ET.156.01.1.1]TGU47625.1 anti-sigma factor [bacterium M00.F.Ca.ET.146.01.1.1]TGV69753.1 anti-sigma factor [Mesorhizobium sp. M2D.F.C